MKALMFRPLRWDYLVRHLLGVESAREFETGRVAPMSTFARIKILGWVGLAFAFGACGGQGTDPADDRRTVTWHTIEWSGGTVNLAVLPPPQVGSGGHPVVFALSWGAGSADLVIGFLETYWAVEPGNRGYFVVAPEVTGSTLADIADELLPAIFSWMDAELPYDPTQVALVGASNGGRGIFHAALSQPNRFQALVGLPGEYSGDPGNLAVLSGKPVWLMVGEFDQGWVAAAQATADALSAVGAEVTLEVLAEQGHVLLLSPPVLMNWIDEALGR